MKLDFPKNFYWGSATSAHQVEGDNHNDWTEWEKANAERLTKKARNYWQPWQQEKFPEMFESKNYISGKACDHYNRFRADFDIAKSLGHNAHRFSIEWSRIEPEQGKFDEKEIEHYRQVISALKERGIEPFVTLWHWTNPIWIRDIGGWENKKTIGYFLRYVEKIIDAFGAEIKFWITLNEPCVYSSAGFLKGHWPPDKSNIFKYFKVLRHLAGAHNKSYKVIKEINAQTQVGISKHNIYFENIPFANSFWNEYFLDKIKNHQDFIGLNYYFHARLFGNKNEQISDLGWEIYPEGIYHVLKSLKKYNKPIYITENGLADAKDEKRAEFIKEHLKWMHKAIGEGVDVRGYFYWSLLDNFEWDKGFWPRFGLVEIDYKTMARKIRNSALEYADICKNNALDSDF